MNKKIMYFRRSIKNSADMIYLHCCKYGQTTNQVCILQNQIAYFSNITQNRIKNQEIDLTSTFFDCTFEQVGEAINCIFCKKIILSLSELTLVLNTRLLSGLEGVYHLLANELNFGDGDQE